MEPETKLWDNVGRGMGGSLPQIAMSVVLITGSNGLIGSETARHFGSLGMGVVGVDNDMRSTFFGPEASTAPLRHSLERTLNGRYHHHEIDVRDRDAILKLVARYARDLALVVHTAAQPSHDWAAQHPFVDFDINAAGTLNLLEATRRHAPEAVFIFTSTNKVYGDAPNRLPLVELETRWEIERGHRYEAGIPEDMSVDASLHSLFGASKLAADVLVQEYGRYFGLSTACFRAGTLTGPNHAAAELHGFLGYVVRCAARGESFKVFGYKGKQVRDALHSRDLVAAFDAFFRAPRVAAVYNIGGGRENSISVIEALALAEEVVGRALPSEYVDKNRVGDHIWWISDNSRFRSHYPDWRIEHDLVGITEEIRDANAEISVPTL
jgi:CDP-paratose 2-epimerase